MTLRLLPWTGPDGNPCYLSTDDDDSYLSRLADTLEAVQIDMAEDLLDHVHQALAADTPSELQLRLIVNYLTEALRDTLRVAESRAARIPAQQQPSDPESTSAPEPHTHPTDHSFPATPTPRLIPAGGRGVQG